MKKIITIATLLLTSSLYASTYTYNELLQSVMGTGKKIELQAGDIIDFENGYTITIQGNQDESRAFGKTLKEIKNSIEKIEKNSNLKTY